MPSRTPTPTSAGALSRTDSALDTAILAAQSALHTVFGAPVSSRACKTLPEGASAGPQDPLSADEKTHAGALMRVNHVGEVCAQALYAAQTLATNNPALKAHFAKASQEETDHLAWTAGRLQELGGRPSLLNPLWYAGAFAMGFVAGKLGDRVSLGFVEETERQVEAHLQSHLELLPKRDQNSRAIVAQMREEEAAHALEAKKLGALPMPLPVQAMMRAAAKVMTRVAYRI